MRGLMKRGFIIDPTSAANGLAFVLRSTLGLALLARGDITAPRRGSNVRLEHYDEAILIS